MYVYLYINSSETVDGGWFANMLRLLNFLYGAIYLVFATVLSDQYKLSFSLMQVYSW